MSNAKIFTAIGLMSGTSLDGIDAALIRTDGHSFVEPLDFLSVPYDDDLREDLRSCFGYRQRDDFITEVEQCMTQAHAALVKELARGRAVDLIGFHGQTISHDPANGHTLQIGDGALLARETGIDVVNDFRSADVKAGGEGAPLIPLYHAARGAELPKPVVILNIGGVANVTYIAECCHSDPRDSGREESQVMNKKRSFACAQDDMLAKLNIIAFDTGPGNALLDDWVKSHTGARYDQDGAFAAAGKIDDKILHDVLRHSYFGRPVPKSLDRDEFTPLLPSPLSRGEEEKAEPFRWGVEDGAATLTAFTVEAIVKALDHFPEAPRSWYVTGGGRHNKTMMRMLADKTGAAVHSVDDLGWNGDALEAEGFAYLAVRSVLGAPLSLPTTTGGKTPQTGGVLHKAL